MKKAIVSLAIVSSLTASFALAEQPSFNLVEVGYSDIEDMKGFSIRGSVEVSDLIYVKGDYSARTEEEDGAPDFDANTSLFGVGAKFALGDTTALYTEAQYRNVDVEISNKSDSEDGYALAAGVRSMIADKTEFYGEIAHVDIDGASTEFTVGGRQYLTENIGVFAQYQRDDYDNYGYTVGVGVKF